MQTIIIDNISDSDQRIDKFLKKYLRNASLGAIYKFLRTGKIKVNKKKVEQTYRIVLNDEVQFFLTDSELGEMKKETTKKPILQNTKIDILYEDRYFLAVNKPAWMNVHPWDHKSTEASLIELVQDMLGEDYRSLSFRPALVHRIDRDTTGLVLIAKEKGALESLLSDLQNSKIGKIYHTIVVGIPEKRRDTISVPLRRRDNAQDEAKVIVDLDAGQRAITHTTLIQSGISGKYSLLECQIETGRTHQIRVHLAHRGTPILGDKAYGNKKENSFARGTFSITRQLLHAHSLILSHPITWEKMTLIAPYPDDFVRLLEYTE